MLIWRLFTAISDNFIIAPICLLLTDQIFQIKNAIFRLGFLPALTGHVVASSFLT